MQNRAIRPVPMSFRAKIINEPRSRGRQSAHYLLHRAFRSKTTSLPFQSAQNFTTEKMAENGPETVRFFVLHQRPASTLAQTSREKVKFWSFTNGLRQARVCVGPAGHRLEELIGRKLARRSPSTTRFDGHTWGYRPVASGDSIAVYDRNLSRLVSVWRAFRSHRINWLISPEVHKKYRMAGQCAGQRFPA